MNEESQIKLQAHLDGELPADEAAGVQQWLARDPEAAALLAELKNTRAALSGQEAEVKLPETREFFWSKIEREIERQERRDATAEPAPRKSFWSRWGWRGLAPAGGLAVACVVALHLASPSAAVVEFVPELDVASDDMGAYTFRNQADGLTMIWLYERNSTGQAAKAPSAISLASK